MRKYGHLYFLKSNKMPPTKPKILQSNYKEEKFVCCFSFKRLHVIQSLFQIVLFQISAD